ncbi:MAG: PhzF family phenazine biosynthesis protein [Anaerolineae bacterium]|jgi:PhzF family phenazine biosynthesis protein|nr:PhzF family phenazine biosynthesis protein [Anaerolineae bacterium]MBT7191814.1 PhzF family phenazine biosynthesis protein [Anaerolineae bacterium]MBT7992085.1 PhzF family phenazine biosynthesis protein [Anaerolineae bacterium]
MNIQEIAAFANEGIGGNPAGVVICDEMPKKEIMLNLANQVGYSETAFLKPYRDGWKIRYFSPEIEIPFCGHATIASGAALGDRFGEGAYKLFLNNDEISVDVRKSENGRYVAALYSPKTWSRVAPQKYVEKILKEFKLTVTELDPNFPIRFAFAGAKHLLIVLKGRKTLAEMNYHFKNTKSLMLQEDLATISLLWNESGRVFHSRNAFASGGVVEDPATGAAAAALAGYLRDIDWQGSRKFEVIQGEDMGYPSRLFVEYTSELGASVKVAGETRYIVENNS